MEKREMWNLIIARLENTITSGEDCKLEEWLKEEEHRKLFDEVSDLWKKAQQRSGSYAPSAELYWERLANRLDLPASHKKQGFYSMKLFYRMAACIAVLAVLSFSFYGGVKLFMQEELLEQCYTNVSGKSKVELPDGTVAWLHSGTKLTYNSASWKKDRSVNLEGEAYFEVAKNAEQRFVVHTGDVNITVYGTKFNVVSIPGSDNVNVSLLEGSVALTTRTKDKKFFLKPGERATYDKKSRQVLITEDEVEMNAAWATPTVRFSGQTLREVCEVLSHRFDIHVEVAPEVGDQYTYTFTLHDENIVEILEMISSIHSIRYSLKNDGTIVVTK